MTGLKPLGRAVLVQPIEAAPELKSKHGIVIPDTAKDRIMAAEQQAIVIEVGTQAWIDEAFPRAKAGDRVMISKFAGTVVKSPKDGKEYRCVNANDIFLRIEE